MQDVVKIIELASGDYLRVELKNTDVLQGKVVGARKKFNDSRLVTLLWTGGIIGYCLAGIVTRFTGDFSKGVLADSPVLIFGVVLLVGYVIYLCRFNSIVKKTRQIEKVFRGLELTIHGLEHAYFTAKIMQRVSKDGAVEYLSDGKVHSTLLLTTKEIGNFETGDLMYRGFWDDEEDKYVLELCRSSK